MKKFSKNILKRRKTYRFFLRSGEHFDVKCKNLKYVIDHNENVFESYTVDGHNMFFVFLLKELIAITQVK